MINDVRPLASICLPKLHVLTLFGNHINVENGDMQTRLEYLGAQFDAISQVAPNLHELSIEGNPAVEHVL